jgi:hypothetical protein
VPLHVSDTNAASLIRGVLAAAQFARKERHFVALNPADWPSMSLEQTLLSLKANWTM